MSRNDAKIDRKEAEIVWMKPGLQLQGDLSPTEFQSLLENRPSISRDRKPRRINFVDASFYPVKPIFCRAKNPCQIEAQTPDFYPEKFTFQKGDVIAVTTITNKPALQRKLRELGIDANSVSFGEGPLNPR